MEILTQLATGAGIGGVLAGILYLTSKQKDRDFVDYVKAVDAREQKEHIETRRLLERTLTVIEHNTQVFQNLSEQHNTMEKTLERIEEKLK